VNPVFLISLTIANEIILETLDECEQASRGFTTPQSFLNFIQRVEEKNDEMEELRRQPDIEAVRLMTIHNSKGLEFEQVYAIGWAEGILPHTPL
jgi:DNA helicase II / ATP-dependent DNA helicase PcrA